MMSKAIKKNKAVKFKRYAPPAGKAKVLIFDIETAPLRAFVWGLWENNVSLNMIASDWHVLSWSAKWLNSPDTEVMYVDQRGQPNVEDDKALLQGIWDLLDEADVVITQNGKSFDQKKLQARFLLNGFKPHSSYKHIDTKLVAKKHFAFTSNKLEYMSDKLCTKYKKLKHKQFPGFELWDECLKDNLKAWKEMELYNKHDVLALEELYNILMPWEGDSVNFNLYSDDEVNACKCGSHAFIKNGFYYTSVGKFQKHRCKGCGAESRDRKNLLSQEKRDSLRTHTVR
jgi:DNA polymerase elongation subunit (family B)